LFTKDILGILVMRHLPGPVKITSWKDYGRCVYYASIMYYTQSIVVTIVIIKYFIKGNIYLKWPSLPGTYLTRLSMQNKPVFLLTLPILIFKIYPKVLLFFSNFYVNPINLCNSVIPRHPFIEQKMSFCPKTNKVKIWWQNNLYMIK
jgi:hypothetical protein